MASAVAMSLGLTNLDTPLKPTAVSSRLERWLGGVSGFFQEGGFAAFAISLLAFYQFFVLVMAFTPANGTPWGSFAEEFRVRCFKYDPGTGAIEWGLVWFMLTEPLLLQGVLFVVWRGSLRALWQGRRRALWPLGGASLAAFGVIAACLVKFSSSQAAQTELPFPGERIRTQLPTPDFLFVNQERT